MELKKKVAELIYNFILVRQPLKGAATRNKKVLH